MIMKKLFLYALAAAMVTFAGCQKNEMEGVDSTEKAGSTFEIVADIAQDATKTTLDGRVVEWEEDDIIYMVTSNGPWGVPYIEDNSTNSIAAFTYADGKFSTEATIADGTYTFNAIYSNGSQMSYHRSDKTTNKLSSSQTQDCANPTAHIKQNDALVGTFTATVPMTEPAKLTMSHLYTMMQVDVVNNTGADITVSQFDMTAAGADLAGVFTVTAFDTPAISAKDDEADTETISVKVTGGTVENGGTLPVYFVMAPLSNYSGNVTFKVTDLKGNTYSKTIGLTGISFEAGKYNTTPYAITKADEVVEPEPEGTTATLTFDDLSKMVESSQTKQVWTENDIILTYSKADYNNNLAANANPVRFYANTTITVEAPGNITKIEFACNNASYANVLKNSISGSAVSGSVVTVNCDGTSTVSDTYKMSAQVRVNSLTVTYKEADPNAVKITAANVTGVVARGVENAELIYSVNNLEYSDITVEYDGEVVTSATKGEDGKIVYTVATNSTNSARTGTITITGGETVREVSVAQNAPVFTVSRNAVELEATSGSKTTVTVTSDFDWSLAVEGAGFTVTPESYTWTEDDEGDGKETITIQATAPRTEEGVADLGTITFTNSVTGQKLAVKVTQATSYENAESSKVTMNIFANTGTLNGKSISWTQDGFTVTNNQASSTSAIRTSDSDHFRVYAKSELVFTSSNKTFDKVVVTCSSASYVTALETSAKNAGLTATVSGSVVTISTSASTTAMPTINASAQIRIKKVEVELN